jgi:hypothetical protein
MLRRGLTGLAVALAVVGVALAEDTRGTVVKVEDGSITIRTGGGFGRGKGKGGEAPKAEEKTFKVSRDVKVTRSAGKDKEAVSLTLEELKVAAKVTTVTVTVSHDGDNVTELKVGGGGFAGGRGKGKGKGKDKKDDK